MGLFSIFWFWEREPGRSGSNLALTGAVAEVTAADGSMMRTALYSAQADRRSWGRYAKFF
jgi:hypothetical protein